MDNGTSVQVAEKNSSSGGRVAHVTAATVFMVLSSIAAFFTVYIGVNLFITMAEHEALANAGQSQLGTGIGIAILLILLLISSVIGGILALVGLALSISVVRYREGRARVAGIVYTVLSATYTFVSIALPTVVFILNKF